MLEIMLRRRSIRRFTNQEVDDDQVRQLLEAAMSGPTAHNFQPWQFVIARQRDVRDLLAQTHDYAKMIAQAPVAIVVCADRSKVHWVEDACIAAQNILLEATALGLGATWVAVYPHEEHDAFVKGVLDIPDQLGVVCMIPVGYPAGSKDPLTYYDAAKVHNDRYGKGS